MHTHCPPPCAGRRGGNLSEGSRAAINAFLYRTGTLCMLCTHSPPCWRLCHSWHAPLSLARHPAALSRIFLPIPHTLADLPALPCPGPPSSCPPPSPAGEQSRDFCVVLATNRPSDLDPAVIDRTDDAIEFGLPGPQER